MDTRPIAPALAAFFDDVLELPVSELNFKAIVDGLGDVFFEYPFKYVGVLWAQGGAMLVACFVCLVAADTRGRCTWQMYQHLDSQECCMLTYCSSGASRVARVVYRHTR